MKNFSNLSKLTKISLVLNITALVIVLISGFKFITDYRRVIVKEEMPKYATLTEKSTERIFIGDDYEKYLLKTSYLYSTTFYQMRIKTTQMATMEPRENLQLHVSKWGNTNPDEILGIDVPPYESPWQAEIFLLNNLICMSDFDCR